MSASKRTKDKSKIIEFPNRLRKATQTYDEDDLYDSEWLEKTVVLRMSQAIVDTCYEMLKRKRKPRSVIELYMQFFMKGYLVFTEQDLLEALVKDGRFDVESSDSAFFGRCLCGPQGSEATTVILEKDRDAEPTHRPR